MHYTKHARERMQERGIKVGEVAEVVSDPEATWPGEEKGTTVVVGRTSKGRQLKVVVKSLGRQPIIITVAPRDQ